MRNALALAAILCAAPAVAQPITEEKQYAMVLTATEIMETAQCGTPEKPITKIRFNMWTQDDQPAFVTTVNAIAQIYLADPAGFCRRAALAAGK